MTGIRYGPVRLHLLPRGLWDVSYHLEYWHDDQDKIYTIYENEDRFTLIADHYWFWETSW